MANDELPLFAWTPPKSTLVFPANRWTGKARHVAEKFMNQKSDRAKRRYWDQTIERMLTRLMAAGVEREDALAQIEPFRHAVQAEIDRIADQRQAR